MTASPVITGVGVVAPTGVGADLFWKAACEGLCSIGRLARYSPDHYPYQLAGELTGFDPHDYVEPRVTVQTDRFTHIALAAAELALRDAALDPAMLPPFGAGVVVAAGSGGGEFGQRELQQLWHQGPEHVGPYQSIAWFYAASTGQISIRYGLRGPCGVVVTDEAGGLDAMAHAVRDIRRGAVAMLAGASEAPFGPFSMTCEIGHGLLSRGTDPAGGYLPFTAGAQGFVPAEGGAVVVIEDAAAALARGARPRAIVAGHGTAFSGILRYGDSANGLARAARIALAEAGCGPDEVDVVFADALGTPVADRAEAQALQALFGPRARLVPVTAPKAGTGRAFAGAAAIDTVTAVLSLQHGVIPPTPNVVDTCHDLDIVRGAARAADVRTALVLARGMSGTNSALVLRRSEAHGQQSRSNTTETEGRSA